MAENPLGADVCIGLMPGFTRGYTTSQLLQPFRLTNRPVCYFIKFL